LVDQNTVNQNTTPDLKKNISVMSSIGILVGSHVLYFNQYSQAIFTLATDLKGNHRQLVKVQTYVKQN